MLQASVLRLILLGVAGEAEEGGEALRGEVALLQLGEPVGQPEELQQEGPAQLEQDRLLGEDQSEEEEQHRRQEAVEHLRLEEGLREGARLVLAASREVAEGVGEPRYRRQCS